MPFQVDLLSDKTVSYRVEYRVQNKPTRSSKPQTSNKLYQVITLHNNGDK